MPSGASTRPLMPVSSSTSRTAASSWVSPASTWPFGSDQSSRPRRSRRPISATRGVPSVAVDDQPAGGGLLDLAQAPRPSRGGAPAAAGAAARRRGRGSSVDRSQQLRRPRQPAAARAGCSRPYPASRARRPCNRALPRPASRRWRLRGAGWPPSCSASRRSLGELARRFAAAGHELAPGRRLGARRRCSAGPAHGPRLHHRCPARADRRSCSSGWADASWDVGHRVRHRRRAQGRPPGRGDDLPRRGLRRDSRKPEVTYGDTPRGRPAAARLHGQRDGRRRCPTTTFVDPYGGLDDLAARRAADARPRRRSRSPTTRCGCCGLRGSPRSWGSRSTRPCVAAMTRDGRPDRRSCRPSGCATSWPSCCSRPTRAPASGCWSRPGWPTTCCPSCRGWRWRSTSTTGTRTSTSTP